MIVKRKWEYSNTVEVTFNAVPDLQSFAAVKITYLESTLS